jgi:hypothetical protein
MLAREFKTATDLGIPQDVHDALVAFTREEKVSDFDMGECARCVAGYVDSRIGGFTFSIFGTHPILQKIFAPFTYNDEWDHIAFDHSDLTLPRAQEAVRNALTFGDPRWADVMEAK